MKKLLSVVVTGVMAFGIYTGSAFAKEGNNGNHNGWNNPNNPHHQVETDSLETKLNSLLVSQGVGSVTSLKHETYISWVDGQTYPKITVESTSIDAVNFLFNSLEVYKVLEEVTGFDLYTPGSSPTGMGVEFYMTKLSVEEKLMRALSPYVTNFGMMEVPPCIKEIVVTDTEVIVHTIGWLNSNDYSQEILDTVEQATGKQIEQMFYHAGTTPYDQTTTFKFIN